MAGPGPGGKEVGGLRTLLRPAETIRARFEKQSEIVKGQTMSKLTITILSCCTLLNFIADVATAQRSSVVIGESLAKVKNPKADKLESPFGVDFDRQGNMYIVELSGGRVHKLDSAGSLTTIAGDGTRGYTGDNGPARNAKFNGMHNVAVTPVGDLYIADSWNHCVRRIDGQTGIITTVAGTGKTGLWWRRWTGNEGHIQLSDVCLAELNQ